MKKLAIVMTAIAMMVAPAAAHAAACRDAKGHFVKCAGTGATSAAHNATAPQHAVTGSAARHTPCRDAKGRFKKC